MALEHDLAVAGAARERATAGPCLRACGPIALMGAATSVITGLLRRARRIAYLGLAITLYVALRVS
jgi:hypothetical protein